MADDNEMQDKRFAFIPISYENKEKAIVNEIIVDRETADVSIKRADGQFVSRTRDLDLIIQDLISTGIQATSLAYNNNRKVYKLYYQNGSVRLDSQLEFPEQILGWRVRDINNEGSVYYTNVVSISSEAELLDSLKNNDSYFVEFYNINNEMISQLVFTAKYAPAVIEGSEPSQLLKGIEIETNKDKFYQGEVLDGFMVKVWAVFYDDSRLDITERSDVTATYNIDTATVGDYDIRAYYYYDSTGLYKTATKTIPVLVNDYADLTDLHVFAKKIVDVNDGDREIRLGVVAYFDDGTSRDVSDEAVIGNTFDDSLFNTVQTFSVKFNAGYLDTVTKTVNLQVNDDGSSTLEKIFYDDNIFTISSNFTLDASYKYYRVRHISDLSFYYTMGAFIDITQEAPYVDKTVNGIISESIEDGNNVIVEFYDVNKTIVDSVIMATYYSNNE